jgi:PAS domain S-box-containing protein
MPTKPSGHDEPSSSPSAHAIGEAFLSTQFLETIPDAIVAVDRDGTIVQVNSQAEALFGYRRGELMGQKIEILVPERSRGLHQDHRAASAHAPKIRRMGAWNLRRATRSGETLGLRQ